MIICGDCLVEMAKMEPNSIDAIVTDPPYGLEFMGKDWDRLIDKRPSHDADKAAYRASGRHGGGSNPHVQSRITYRAGTSAQDWHYAWAVAALRVAKPGCHLLAFGGTRTFHRLTCAIEDAGWEIRDTLMWVYGSGFPKSESVSLAIDKKACRLELEARLGRKPTKDELKAAWEGYRKVIGKRDVGPDIRNDNYHRDDGDRMIADITAPATDAARQWEGWGTALKPAWEPIILARKPLAGTVEENVQKWGTGAINVEGCRVGFSGPEDEAESKVKNQHGDFGSGPVKRSIFRDHDAPRSNYNAPGRWPANLIHDGSEEVLELFPETKNGGKQGKSYHQTQMGIYTPGAEQISGLFGDSGSAARFFYCAKASRAEREMGCEGMEEKRTGMMQDDNYEWPGTPEHSAHRTPPAKNHHPTVKPLALMRYLCRLITPPNGLILDPFMGSGTTGMAAKAEGFRFIGMEKEKEYCEIAEKRIGADVVTHDGEWYHRECIKEVR